MGFLAWLRPKPPAPRRPWVRPEFLGVAGFLAVLAGLFAAMELAPQSPAPNTAEGTIQRDYVGITPSELGLDPQCDARCMVDLRLAQWEAQHPRAQVLETVTMFYQGELIGYEIVYRE